MPHDRPVSPKRKRISEVSSAKPPANSDAQFLDMLEARAKRAMAKKRRAPLTEAAWARLDGMSPAFYTTFHALPGPGTTWMVHADALLHAVETIRSRIAEQTIKVLLK